MVLEVSFVGDFSDPRLIEDASWIRSELYFETLTKSFSGQDGPSGCQDAVHLGAKMDDEEAKMAPRPRSVGMKNDRAQKA